MRWVLAAAGGLAVLFGARRARDRRARESTLTRRESASADALAEEIRASIDAYGFATPDASRRFTREHAWTDASLLGELDAFYEQAVRHDDRSGKSSRDGEVFAFYDAGLAAMGQVLAKRLARGAK